MKFRWLLKLYLLGGILRGCAWSTSAPLVIEDPWVRAAVITEMDAQEQSPDSSAHGGASSSVYLIIYNQGSEADVRAP